MQIDIMLMFDCKKEKNELTIPVMFGFAPLSRSSSATSVEPL